MHATNSPRVRSTSSSLSGSAKVQRRVSSTSCWRRLSPHSQARLLQILHRRCSSRKFRSSPTLLRRKGWLLHGRRLERSTEAWGERWARSSHPVCWRRSELAQRRTILRMNSRRETPITKAFQKRMRQRWVAWLRVDHWTLETWKAEAAKDMGRQQAPAINNARHRLGLRSAGQTRGQRSRPNSPEQSHRQLHWAKEHPKVPPQSQYPRRNPQ